ncbi:MAG: zf-HC2 domain-containing protein [Chloroflexota bacterium]|nr:zf-HC2 domain-containing protein [Chloroflexota bacterium]
MTCEWAEEHLSAYLDDALDPQLRMEVGAHIEQCAHCQALAAEYRRNDELVAKLAPLSPSDQLRQRIFESPEFAALTRELEREGADPSPGSRPSRRVPLYLRALVPAAALLVVSMGAALLFRQGLLPHGGQSSGANTTHTIGGPSGFNLPLSAGPRLVYLSDGALWSVAEYAPGAAANTPGAPQRLTAATAHVQAWSVSPTGANGGGGRIAWVDGATGALHIVHSDGQADTIVGYLAPSHASSASFWQTALGRAALDGLAWSPDGSRIAWVSVSASGDAQVHSYQLDGAGLNATVAAAQSAPITALAWSADSHALAFATSDGAVVVWRGAGRPAITLPAARDAQATATQLAWGGSTLTWATATPGGAITGVYALPTGAGAATRLTAAGARYSAAAFTAARGGVWLLADANTLSEARLAAGGGVAQVASLPARVSALSWSPNGARAALLLGGQLALWSDAGGLAPLAGGVSATPAPVWSADSAALAVVQGQNVSVYQVAGGGATQVAQLSGDATPLALAWATDGRAIALAETQGTLLVTTDGARQTLLTSHPAADGAMSWSLAG